MISLNYRKASAALKAAVAQKPPGTLFRLQFTDANGNTGALPTPILPHEEELPAGQYRLQLFAAGGPDEEWEGVLDFTLVIEAAEEPEAEAIDPMLAELRALHERELAALEKQFAERDANQAAFYKSMMAMQAQNQRVLDRERQVLRAELRREYAFQREPAAQRLELPEGLEEIIELVRPYLPYVKPLINRMINNLAAAATGGEGASNA